MLKSTPKSEAPNLAREIHHHRRLHHPHITQLYEVIITETKVWLVLEMCSKGELYEHVIANQQLVEPEAQRIFAQICGAVAYIHNLGIVHRDLKLENIFLDRRNNAKLGDFGFTRENDKHWLNTWCGSLSYCAPEIVRGDRYQGEAIDIWSLGVILFVLLSGQLPFDHDEDMMTKSLILETRQTYPSFFSEEVRNLLDLMLHKDADQRPSALEVLSHPFMAVHGAYQLAHLDEPYVPTFTTKMERSILERLGVAGIEMEKVMSSVTDYRCDSLCGWWWLSLQRERRRERRYRAVSKRRSVDLNNDTSLSEPRHTRPSRSRRGSADYRPQPNAGLKGYAFPQTEAVTGNDSSNTTSLASSTGVAAVEAAPPVPSKASVPAVTQKMQAQNPTSEYSCKPSDSKSDSSDITPTASNTHQIAKHDELDERKRELGARKQGIMQSFKSWWSEQTKSGRTDVAKTSKFSPGLHRKVAQLRPIVDQKNAPTLSSTEQDSGPLITVTSDEGASHKIVRQQPNFPVRPAYRRRKSSQLSIISTRSTRKRQEPGSQTLLPGSESSIYPFSTSPTKSSSSVDRQYSRPNMHRTASASSTHSSATSFRAGGHAGHSKASSTSSNSTFASTRSIRSPRNPLKVMPSTPPPFMIAHQGGYKERNVFDSSLASAHSPVAFASRKRSKRGVLLETKKLGGRKRLEMNEVPIEEEEEDEGGAGVFVDVEEQEPVVETQYQTVANQEKGSEVEEEDEVGEGH